MGLRDCRCFPGFPFRCSGLLRFLGIHGSRRRQHPVHGFFADGLSLLHPLELHRVVEHVELDLHGLVVGGFQHGLLDLGHVLLNPLVAFHADTVLAGIGVRGKRGDRHGGYHPEFVGNLLLVHAGSLHRLGHPAAALPLKPLEVGLHFVVDGLFGVVKESLVGLCLGGQFPRGIISHPVFVNGLELDAIIHVILVLVVIGGPFLPAKKPPLFLFLLLFLRVPLFGLLPGRLFLVLDRLHPGQFQSAGGIGV